MTVGCKPRQKMIFLKSYFLKKTICENYTTALYLYLNRLYSLFKVFDLPTHYLVLFDPCLCSLPLFIFVYLILTKYFSKCFVFPILSYFKTCRLAVQSFPQHDSSVRVSSNREDACHSPTEMWFILQSIDYHEHPTYSRTETYMVQEDYG